MKNTKQIGDAGEEFVCRYLQRKGYKIAERNFRIRVAEVDIIASKKDLLVFVEVKMRKDDTFSKAFEAVNGAKQRKIRMAAEAYLAKAENRDKNARFDVAEVYGTLESKKLKLNYLANAF